MIAKMLFNVIFLPLYKILISCGCLLGVEALVYEKDIKLNYTIEPSLKVLFNQEQLNQAIMILLDNAIKYTPNKGSITVSLIKTNNHTLFKIKNTGEGIKDENIPYLFERFYKIDESRQNTNESYGLGLSILKANRLLHRFLYLIGFQSSVL
jgi:two-component system sensor histidine kinase CiaH